MGLSQLAEGVIDRATFAGRFGHRGPHEAEVCLPRPAEDPNWIDQQAASLRQSKEDATALLARQEATRQAAWNRIRRESAQRKVASSPD